MRGLLILIIVLSTLLASSQDHTVSGRLTDPAGEPLPGVNILIKGTNKGTVSDLEGFYQITAPIGSILVFSFVGFENREVLVTGASSGKNSRSRGERKKEPIQPHFQVEFLNDTIRDQEGVGRFMNRSRSFRSQYHYLNVDRIKKVIEKEDQFIIKTLDGVSRNGGYGLQYSQVIGISRVAQLPALQTAYAQGRPIGGRFQWAGAATNEIFSWGPRVHDLEYDGSTYAYDTNGQLVQARMGNGVAAKSYDNLDFFRIGVTNKHDLLLTHSVLGSRKIIAGVDWEDQRSVIPGAEKERFKAKLNIKDMPLGQGGHIQFQTHFTRSDGAMLAHGANLARILSDVLTTPITFDNANGLSRKEAVDNSLSYEVAPGQGRSYAPDVVNNPFGRVATSPDRDDHTHYFSGIAYKWSSRYHRTHLWKLNVKSSYDLQELNAKMGVPFGYVGSATGLLIDRSDKKSVFDLGITPSYRFSHSDYPHWDLTFILDYQLSSVYRELHKQEGTDFFASEAFVLPNANTRNEFRRSLSRNSHQLSYTTKFEFKNHTLKVGNQHYFSTTIRQADLPGLLPFIGASTTINVYPITLFPKVSYAKTAGEATLIYNDWAYASTRGSSAEFRTFNETSELVFHADLRPEVTTKMEFDLAARFDFLYDLNLGFTYSHKTIDDLITPIHSGGEFALDNVAKVSEESINASISYRYNDSWDGINGTITTRWARNLPKVIETSVPGTVPLAGFDNAFSAMAAGQPLGVIYGTYYERDEEGHLIIDSEGYPTSTGEVKTLANPNPDWVLGFDGEVSWRNLTLNVLLEYLHGAETWNGTAAYLDYLGRSAETGSLREVNDFVFEGVDERGEQNTIPVNFVDPLLDISQSRWARYGPAGVAEAYIENASSFRLSELVLGYMIPFHGKSMLKELSLSLIASNLLQITPYSGVDPASTLFGYIQGRGLDLFNMPATRSYQLKMIMKL